MRSTNSYFSILSVNFTSRKFYFPHCFTGNILDLSKLLRKIEKEATSFNILKLQIPLHSPLFFTCNETELQLAGLESLVNLQITLTPKLIKVFDTDMRYELMEKAHVDLFHHHLSSKLTIDILHEGYLWPGLVNDVRNFIKSCDFCKSASTFRTKDLRQVSSVSINKDKREDSTSKLHVSLTEVFQLEGVQKHCAEVMAQGVIDNFEKK